MLGRDLTRFESIFEKRAELFMKSLIPTGDSMKSEVREYITSGDVGLSGTRWIS
jgi:hypothetical protein